MDILAAVFSHILHAVKSTALQVLVLVGPGIALAGIMHAVSTSVTRAGVRLFGFPFYYFTFIGTMLHELSHAAFCLVFRHRITDISLFKPDRAAGSLGRVNHSFNPASPYQVIGLFFIGIAPIIIGCIAIYAAAVWLVSPDFFAALGGAGMAAGVSWVRIPANILNASFVIVGNIFAAGNFGRWQFYLFIYIVLSIGGNLRLSMRDIRGAGAGFFLFSVILLAFNLVALLFGGISISFFYRIANFYSFFYVIMFAALLMNLLLLAPLYLFGIAKGKTRE